jgi:hypothetical protein
MYLIFFFSFVLFLWQIHRNASYISESLSDYFIKLFFGLVSCVIPTGFLLSEYNLINQDIAWGIGVNVLAFLFNIFFRQIVDNQSFSFSFAIKELRLKFVDFWKSQSITSKVSFGILFIGLGITTIINLIIFFVTVPNEWDSMTGHLVKCAYYLQNGNMNRLGGTTWTIDFYPNSLPTLQIFGYHVFGEKGFKVIHYICYWLFALSAYGIAKKIAPKRRSPRPPMGAFSTSALLVFVLSGLLPTALVQATTTESDIVLSAYLGCLTYFLFSFKEKPNKLNISLIALMSGIWIGHKVTFLLIAPAILVVVFHTVLFQKAFYRNIKLFIATFIIAISIYALPTGYIGNVREVGKFSIGSLSAPPMVMQWHGVEHYSGKDQIKNMSLNIGRYSSEFLNFDGLRSSQIGQKLNEDFRYLPNKIFRQLNLESKDFTVVSYFSFEHPIRFYLERPYWGIIGFGMVFPIMIILLIKLLRNFKKTTSTEKSLMVLSLAAVLHFLSLCYSAPYDPIKARYFLNMAVWCMPLLLVIGFSLVGRKSVFKLILFTVYALLISISAISTVLFVRIHPIFSEKNIFNMTRMEQLTVARPHIYEAYKKFDEIVPQDAIVALGTQQEHEDFEYPLWGKDFTRKLIPIHPFRSEVKPIPAEAQYLFYSKGVIPFQEGDILLNSVDTHKDTPVEESQFFLRKLPLRP